MQRNMVQYFLRHPREVKVLKQIQTEVESVAKRTVVLEGHPVNRLVCAVRELMGDLMLAPDQANKARLKTLSQAFECLCVMFETVNLSRTHSLPEPKILHVDDEDEIRAQIALALETLHIPAAAAQTPKAGLQELAANRYDLLILDLQMPGMSGFDMCAEVRNMPEYKTTPVMFVTGQATTEARAHSTLLGGNDFIAKPFMPSEIAAKALTWAYRGQLGTL
jgi:CheY-like chemotaxis protein